MSRHDQMTAGGSALPAPVDGVRGENTLAPQGSPRPADVDEAVQDAFVKAYTHIKSFQRNLSFEVWLTRILINGCLDRQKARTRRSRWMMPVADAGRRDQDTIEQATRPSDRSPEAQLMAREWREQLVAAVDKLPDRPRVGFMLFSYSHYLHPPVS